MKATLEPFVAEHGVELLGAAAQPCLTFLLRAQYEGPAFTGRLEDGRILGAAGFIEDMPYSATAWLIPTPLVKQYPILFHRTILAKWAYILRLNPWRRVQTLVDPKFPERVRWIERLGFAKEGIARAGGVDGQDLWYYGWLRSNGNGSRSSRDYLGSGGSRLGGRGSLRGDLGRPGCEEGRGL